MTTRNIFLWSLAVLGIALFVFGTHPASAAADVPAGATPASTQPKETKPAELKTVGAFNLKNPLGNRSVPQLLGQLVAWLGAIGGSLFFAYLMWGGIQWMTAGGSSERVKAGRGKIIAAVSGIAVILLAYLIIESLIGVISLK